MGKTLQTLRIVCFLQSYYKQQSLGLFLIRSCAVYNIQHNFGGAQSESAQTKHGIYGTESEFKTDEHRLRCSGRSADRSSNGTDVWQQGSLVPDFRFIRSLNLHAGAFLESLVTFVRAGVGLSHVTIAHIN